MERIKINASTVYEVIVGKGILNKAGEFATGVISPCNACIITDDIVESLYLDTVKNSLESFGFKTKEYVIKNGESSKNINNLNEIAEFLAQNSFTREDIIVALGGGVVGDLAGFAAATYMRGIKFIQIPTTLLAQIDSSVGGKTAVNLKAGKNLLGAFHQPSLVICDTNCLSTLKKEDFSGGMGEAVKYAVLCDKNLINLLKENPVDAISRCIKIKSEFVNNDEFEKGSRKFLNLGHTFGHSIELLSGFSISHGHAVAIGIKVASEVGEKLGITSPETTKEIIKLLKEMGLPTECSFSGNEIYKVLLSDKKRHGDKITLVVPEKIGKCKLLPVPVSQLSELLDN